MNLSAISVTIERKAFDEAVAKSDEATLTFLLSADEESQKASVNEENQPQENPIKSKKKKPTSSNPARKKSIPQKT